MTAAWPTRPGIAGVDEAGRGPLAGPVVAAAVILPLKPQWAGLDDSKKLTALGTAPREVRVDGNRLPPKEDLPFVARWEAVVKGDAREAAIAAASILAKTARDQFMIQADERYPGYGFARHKGYGTAQHLDALTRWGLTPLHRQSFEPVKSWAQSPSPES